MLITTAILFGFITSNNFSNEVLSDALSALGSLFGGIAGLLAAAAALIGLGAWKKQLRHGKYLSTIWETKVHLRKVESSAIDCLVKILMAVSPNSTPASQATFKDSENNLLKQIEDLKSSCMVIDKLIMKKGWLNSNDAGFIMSAWQQFKLDYISSYIDLTNATTPKNIKLYLAHCDLNEKNFNGLTAWIELIDKRLDSLEAEYT
jgi:hypothetical protein